MSIKLIDILLEDFPKGEYVTPKQSEKSDLKNHLYDLIQNAYSSIGGHLKITSPDDITTSQLQHWKVADIDADPEIDVVYFGKETPFGVKHTGMGHDGERSNIKNLLIRKSDTLKKPGNYVEVSGAAFDSFVNKGGVPIIDDEQIVRKMLGDKRSITWHGVHPDKTRKGNGWYTRTIGGKAVTKTMAGVV